jgi:hypothetical protein
VQRWIRREQARGPARKDGYIILLASPVTREDAEDRQIFESMRRSFRFTQ